MRSSANSIRTTTDVEQLSQSVREHSLLQPIVVRPKEEYYEIIAGHRRYAACKRLGWKKMRCNIIELGDKESFEISLIENIQRKSMNPIEEAKAYNLYVQEYGWGGVSELSRKIGKSQECISKRLKLLDLPEEIQNQIIRHRIKSSLAEELCYIKNKKTQSTLARLISRRHLTVKKIRQAANSTDNLDDMAGTLLSASRRDNKHCIAAFDRAIVSLKLTLNHLSDIIEDIQDDWYIHEMLLQHRLMIHNQISTLIRNRKKYMKLSDI